MKRALRKIMALLLVIVLSVCSFSACSNVNVIIKFMVDGKSYSAVAVTNADDIDFPTEPTKEGYTFDGWYLDQNIWSKPLNAKAIREKGEGIITAYAKFTTQASQVSFSLSKTSVSLGVGDTYRITADDKVGVSNSDFRWSSNNTAVATVSGGTVKGVKEGTAVITATAKGVSKTCVVTVTSTASSITGSFSLIVRYPNGTGVNGHSDGTGGSSGTEVQIVFYSSDKTKSYPAVTLDQFGEVSVSASAVYNALQDDTIIATVVGVPLGFSANDKTLTLTNRSGIISLADTRSRLYVSNFSAGFGHVWLDKAIERFEKAYANFSFETGKKGVKVVADNNRNSAQTILNNINSTSSEVFFMEGASYNDFVSRNALLDISDVVKSKAGNDSVTIESKLTNEQKGFYSKTSNYYGLPHYGGYMGIIYDKDSFANNGYYFAGDTAIIQGYNTLVENDKYIFATSTQAKSNGPDGLHNTYDDGLPSTYDEFFALCDYIVSKGKKPITWNGIAPVDYLENLMQSLAATSDGKEQTMINYEVWGSAETLGRYEMGGFVPDSEATIIVGSTAEELARQKGKYDALTFAYKLLKGKSNVYYPSAALTDSTYTQYDSQDDFLYGIRNGGQYPMMVDGAWWQGEATESINKMVNSYGNAYSKQNRNFGFMPYPKPDENYVGKDNVLFDHLSSLCAIKRGISPTKQEMAKEFVRFMYSHESLFEFTRLTDVPKAVNYQLSDSEKAQLTPFAKSLCEVKENSQIVYPVSKSNLLANVPGAFLTGAMFTGRVNGADYRAINAITAGISIDAFFDGMYVYRQNLTFNW